MEPGEPALTHIDAAGAAQMVDVSDKPKTTRVAAAVGRIFLAPATLALIESNGIAKGNVLATARIAGIQAAKKTGGLIPLCHTLLLYHVQIDFEFEREAIFIRCEVRTVGRTGAEMEALAGVSIAALTIYDMCKAVDKTMRIGDLTLASKSKTPLI
jgi:cyclic pyranopterin phosphate synthase